MEITSYRHEYNPDFIKEISIKFLNRSDHNILNGSVIFYRDINDFEVVLSANVPRTNGRSRSVFETKTNGCQLLSGDFMKSPNLLTIIWNKVKNMNAKFPTKCPVKRVNRIKYVVFFSNYFAINFLG